MKTRRLIVLAVGVLVMAAQFVAIYNDAWHGVAHYRREAASSLPAHR